MRPLCEKMQGNVLRSSHMPLNPKRGLGLPKSLWGAGFRFQGFRCRLEGSGAGIKVGVG